MKNVEGGVVAAKGFKTAGINVGIKPNNTKRDMAMIFSSSPCVTAATFTTNQVKAAPVKWDYKVVHECESSQAVVINTGIANACTGEEGYGYCEEMARQTGEVLGIVGDSVLVASTGVIGQQLPMEKIKEGIEKLAPVLSDNKEEAIHAAEAIMTTDTVPKQVAVEIEVGGKTAYIGGMCKGAGMIHPNMATMLCFITTDVNIDKALMQEALSDIVKNTFNMISVDGDTSTNDTVLVLANGLCGNSKITAKNEDYKTFYEALNYIMEELSKKIAGDGEGATCLFEVKVVNARSVEQAKVLAKSIVTSNLTKAAIFGHDANWGRILCAMGYSNARFNPDVVDIYFESEEGNVKIVENGRATDYSEEFATKVLSAKKVTAIADIKQGAESATAWGCDLTFDYVKINADYRS